MSVQPSESSVVNTYYKQLSQSPPFSFLEPEGLKSWLGESKLLKAKPGETIVSFKSFRESFISDVKLDKNNWTIKIVSNKKPFKLLEGCWIINEKKENCEVSFEIQFELKSIILEKIIGIVFFQSVKSIVKAFEEQCLKSNNLIS